MPKDKKKGLFSLFRKKTPKEQPTAAQAVIPPDSFGDINDLIPTPEIIYQKPIEKPLPPSASPLIEPSPTTQAIPDAKVEKAHKKARAAPPPPQERAVDVEIGPKKPPRDLKKELSIEEKKAIIRQQLSSDEESRKSSISSGSRIIETNVLHYSTQTQHRTQNPSPIPFSEAPPVERQSNIILNGTTRIKSIPVSQYDGRPKQTAPPPPPPLISLPSIPPPEIPTEAPPSATVTSPISYHKKQSSQDSTMNSRHGLPRLDAPPKAIAHRVLTNVEAVQPTKTKEEEDLEIRYENIKKKFDLWQMLKNDERHSKEAKKLQMELIRDHDILLELAKGTTPEEEAPSPGQIVKKRPSIAPDTYTPKLSLANGIRSPLTISANYSNNSLSSSSPNSSSSPGTSRSATPKHISSSPSVSPAASVESADSGVIRNRKSEYATPKVHDVKKPQQVDENANLLKKITKPRDSIEIQRQNAINRINDEVREQRRKETELKRLSQPVFPAEEVKSKENKERPLSMAIPKLPKTEAAPVEKSKNPSKKVEVSRIMVNTSPTPSPIVNARSPLKESPIIQRNGKTIVSMNKEKVYALPKKAPESPKTPPLPVTAQPKLPYMNTRSVDEVIYKVSVEKNNNLIIKKDPPQAALLENKTPSPPTNSNKVTTTIKSTIVTTREEEKAYSIPIVKKEEKSYAVPVVQPEKLPPKMEENESVSRNIADTLAKHNKHSRAALDLSEMLDKTTLRKVTPPVERNGIAMGRVIDAPQTPSTSFNPITVTFIQPSPPPPPPPPPMMAAPPPPPPPPPPTDLYVTPIYQVPSPITRPYSIPMAPPPPPLVTSSQLNDQKQRLRTPITVEKTASPLDLRDSLMAEIRNAGGSRGLRKVNR